MSHVQSPAAALAGLAAMLLLAAAAPDAQAAGAGHNPRSQPAAHGMTPRARDVQRTPNSHRHGNDQARERTTSTTVTRDDGRTATRQTTVARDPGAGTRSVQSTATGFNGRTTQYSSEAQRTDDGYTREVSRTLPNGQVNARSIDVSCDATTQSCTKTVAGGRGD
jgi:hypothetical protein